MKACPEYDPLLPLHASGALAPDEAARVEAHLAGCPACRAEADADAEVLASVRLPELTVFEREALRDVPARTVGAFRALERRRRASRWTLAAGGLAAAALLAVIAPALFESVRPERSEAASAAERSRRAASTDESARSTWDPDLDTLWEDTDVLAIEPAAASGDGLTTTDAVLAAWDDAGF